MFRQLIFSVFVLLTLWRFGWPSMAETFFSSVESRVIYGEDNRQDFFQEKDSQWRTLAQSTVALFDFRDLTWSAEDNQFYIEAKRFGPSYGLCEEEPFYDQPTGAFCSGFLADSDIIITAGHCIRNSFNCENVRFVFGYSFAKPDSNPLRIPDKNVFSCQQILHQIKNNVGPDYAIIQLDRHVEEFEPLSMRYEGGIEDGTRLSVVGYPKGIPGKLSHGGRLRSNDNEVYFVADLDTFGGSSGSPVFNSDTRLVEGIIVRGEKDFVYDYETNCRRSYICSEGECRGEDVIRMSEILKKFREDEFISKNSN